VRFLLLYFCFTTLLLANPSLEKIVLQLSWLHQFQFAGFYIAKEKGFYKEVGLEVDILEYQNHHDPIETLIAKPGHYAIGRLSWMIDRMNGKPIVALMALFQSAPSVLISTNPAIKTPKDLAHKRIMMTSDESSSVPIISMLLTHGLRLEDITLQEHSFNVDDLIQGRTDAMASYISNEPFTLEQQQIPHTIFNPKEYGFDFYGDILYTSEAEMQNHPERIKKFYAASKKGWEWAFEHAEESVHIIYEKYNTQHKSLDALRYEAKVLKPLVYQDEKPFGSIEIKKINAISQIYKLSGLLKNEHSLEGFVDPLHLTRKEIKIGVLHNRGDNLTPSMWKDTAKCLSYNLPFYNFTIVPLDIKNLENSVRDKTIDFAITNPIQYVQLEHFYGLSRIATLGNRFNHKTYSRYGSVIFTRSDDKSITTYDDIKGHRVGIVDRSALGGFVMAQKELHSPTYLKKAFVLGTHDAVVKAVLDHTIDVGIVRTDVLERLQESEGLDLGRIKVLGAKSSPDFPFLLSTELYPEWAFARASHTSEELSNQVLGTLVTASMASRNSKTFSWKAPLDYSKIYALLEELKLYPYDNDSFTLKTVLYTYRYAIIAFVSLFLLSLVALAYIRRLNRQLTSKALEIEQFNATLEDEVKERTKELVILNEKLENLAHTDELTCIHNRRHFFELGETYFHLARRSETELFILSLDIDFL
jgi:ABC-type nitrate/sulfonate/bicarbonate transport system substrate-binding protein